MELELNDADQRLAGIVRKMRAMSEAHYSLRNWRPWKAAPMNEFGDDWPVGIIIKTGIKDGKDWHVCTDGVQASEHNCAHARDDAESIAAMHNAWPELLAALEAVIDGRL